MAPVVLLLAVTLPHLDRGAFRGGTGGYARLGPEAVRRGAADLISSGSFGGCLAHADLGFRGQSAALRAADARRLGGGGGIGLGHPKTARIYLVTDWRPLPPGDRVFEPGDIRLYHTVRARQWMKPEERIVYETREFYATVWDPAAAQNSSSPSPLSATSGGDTPR